MFTAEDEQREIIKCFKESFHSQKNARKILYGTGIISKCLLELKEEYNIIGVMDDHYEKDCFAGVPIIRNTEINQQEIKLVIVAKYPSAQLIYDRISPTLDKTIEIVNVRNEKFVIENENLSQEREPGNKLEKYIWSMLCDKGFFKEQWIKSPLTESDFGYMNGILALGFILWIRNTAIEKNIESLCFVARDGYILQEIWNLVDKKYPSGIKAHYVLGSRSALSVTSIYDTADIYEKLRNVPWQRRNSELLHSRFGIDVENTEIDNLDRSHFVEKYANRIIENSRIQRQRYIQYLTDTQVMSNKMAVVDLVSSGTVPYFLEKTIGRKVELLALALSEFPSHSVFDELKASAYLGSELMYAPKRNITKYFYTGLLEGTFTSTEGSFLGFGKCQKAIYDTAEKSQLHLETLNCVHNAMIQFVNEILFFTTNEELSLSCEYVDILWNLLRRKNLHDIRQKLGVQDRY